MRDAKQPQQREAQPAEEHDLIDGIAQDAAREVQRILGEAEKAAADRRASAADQARAVIQQAESKAEEQTERIRSQSASSLRMERRRKQLKLQEQAVQEVLKRVRQRLSEMVGTRQYREVLLAYEPYLLVGIANEWNGTDFYGGYSAAIQRFRDNGFRHTLVITANDWGQGCAAILADGQRLIDSDPDGNVLFDIHIS